MAVQEGKGGTAARWEPLAQTSDFATTGDSNLDKNAASSSQEIKCSANSGAATGQKHSGRGRLTCCCPAAGRHLSKHSVHWAGIASRPYTAPRRAPRIAALVSVSPPRITVFTTASSRFCAWESCQRTLRNAVRNPALLVDVVGRGCDSGALNGTKQATIHFHVFGPACDAAIEFPGIALCTNGLGNRHCEQRVGLPTNRMRMSDRRVLARPLGHPGQIMVGSKDTQWANPHHRAVGLAIRIGPSPQTARDRHAAIKGPRVQPEDVSLPGFLGIVPPVLCQHAGQQQRHLGIIRRLSGNRVPGPSGGELPDTIGIFPSNLLWWLEFHQAYPVRPRRAGQGGILGPG